MEKEHFEILLEEMRSHHNLLADAILGLDRHIEESRRQTHEENAAFQVLIKALTEQMHAPSAKLENHEDRLVQLEPAGAE